MLATSPWEQVEENVFEKFLHLLWTFFGNTSGNWAARVWPVSQNCILRIYKIILRKKLFWKTNEIFHHSQTLSRKFSASCRVFRRGCWNSNLRVQGNILTQNGSPSKFFSILDAERFFWTILEKKVAELSKLDSQFQWKLTGENLLENLQSVNFWKSSGKSSAGCRKKNPRGFQAAFYLSIGTF